MNDRLQIACELCGHIDEWVGVLGDLRKLRQSGDALCTMCEKERLYLETRKSDYRPLQTWRAA